VTWWWEVRDAVQEALRQWEGRGHFSAGDAATDVMAVLVELGVVTV
jgi:hypothetical protein